MPLLDTLRHTIASHGLLAPGDRLLIAVSGGPDSLALLHALHTLQNELALAELAVAHLDHGLRGAESAQDARFVADFCAARTLPCSLGYADTQAVAAQRKISIQQAARDARYAFLETTARQTQTNKIATAHTLEDQTETVLLNLLRGTGLDGLRGIPYQRGPYIRPLRDTPRADVLAYCAAQDLMPRYDPSNTDSSHYTRNRVRLELLPHLEQSYNANVRNALVRLSEIAARDADYLKVQAEAALADAILDEASGRLTLDCRRLRAQHPALLRHILRAAFLRQRGTLEGIAHDHLEPLCAAIHGAKRLPFGLTTPAPHCAARITLRRAAFLALR